MPVGEGDGEGELNGGVAIWLSLDFGCKLIALECFEF